MCLKINGCKFAYVLSFVASILFMDFASVSAQARQSWEGQTTEGKTDRELIAFEFGIGANVFPGYDAEDESYSERLLDFGFGYPDLTGFRYNFATIVRVTQYLGLGIEFAQLETGDTIRHGFEIAEWGSVRSPTQEFEWNIYGLFGLLRGYYWFAPWGALYAQGGAGIGIAAMAFDALSDGPDAHVVEKSETQVNYALSGAAGGLLELSELVGIFLQLSVSYTPVLHNELEETHETLAVSMFGGLRFTIGASQ